MHYLWHRQRVLLQVFLEAIPIERFTLTTPVIGRCRIPESWKVLYDDNGQRKAVAYLDNFQPVPCTVEKDKFNESRILSVMIQSIRLEIELQPGFSGGILEWRVK